MIIVSGKIYVAPGERDGYLAGCRTVVEQARVAPGCLDFTLSADLLEPGRINIYERWDTDEDVERFRGGGPPGEQQAQILDGSVARYRISSVEDA
ncbi:antibiotic biosynthesis monooxygenase family protein [Actinophytocola sp.]|jgi:quinol monooxygenase YgiN|uniref:putative quinol monooxygenase n=1 Tax=Actinophytocola sp. TaxID=1872138 RepID=UPI002EDB96D4